jgi:hypothetical protein
MKHIHFFGCSITAGDELSDSNFFPWFNEINENTTAEEYYNRKFAFLNSADEYYRSYQIQNKILAYPSQLEKICKDVKCYNHATNGAGLDQLIYQLTKLIYSDAKIDYVFFQQPPPNREAMYNVTEATSLQLSACHESDILNSYIKYKMLGFTPWQNTVDELLKLVLVKEMLMHRNIPHCFLDLKSRPIEDQPYLIIKNVTEYHWLLDQIDYDNPFEIIPRRYTLGKHYTLETQIELAEYLKNKYLP